MTISPRRRHNIRGCRRRPNVLLDDRADDVIQLPRQPLLDGLRCGREGRASEDPACPPPSPPPPPPRLRCGAVRYLEGGGELAEDTEGIDERRQVPRVVLRRRVDAVPQLRRATTRSHVPTGTMHGTTAGTRRFFLI
jgi:hypothetical protein